MEKKKNNKSLVLAAVLQNTLLIFGVLLIMSGALLLGLKEEFSEKAGIYGYQAVLTQNASDTYDKAELWNRLSDLSENASVPFIIIGSTLVIVFFFCNRKN